MKYLNLLLLISALYFIWQKSRLLRGNALESDIEKEKLSDEVKSIELLTIVPRSTAKLMCMLGFLVGSYLYFELKKVVAPEQLDKIQEVVQFSWYSALIVLPLAISWQHSIIYRQLRRLSLSKDFYEKLKSTYVGLNLTIYAIILLNVID